jgi:hypothetical protein
VGHFQRKKTSAFWREADVTVQAAASNALWLSCSIVDLPKVLARLCSAATLKNVRIHTLRHS